MKKILSGALAIAMFAGVVLPLPTVSAQESWEDILENSSLAQPFVPKGSTEESSAHAEKLLETWNRFLFCNENVVSVQQEHTSYQPWNESESRSQFIATLRANNEYFLYCVEGEDLCLSESCIRRYRIVREDGVTLLLMITEDLRYVIWDGETPIYLVTEVGVTHPAVWESEYGIYCHLAVEEPLPNFKSAQRAERILDAMNRLLYGDAVAFACRTDYAPFGSIAVRGHFGGKGACLFVDVLAEKPFSFLRAEQDRAPAEGTTEFRVGLQEGGLLILQVDPDGTLAVTWELTELWLVTSPGVADAAALSATLRNASSVYTFVPQPEGDLPVQAAMPESTAPEAEALLEKWNEAVYGGAVDCLYLSDPLLVDRAEYVNDLIVALQRPGVVFDRYVESAPSDFKALGTYGLGWSKGGKEQRLTVTVSEEGRVFVSAEGFSGGLYTEECVSVDLIRWTTALWTKVSEEASYPGKGTPRPSVLPVPECKDEEAAQKAQVLLDGWGMAIWDAKISYVTFIGRHNKSPVQIGDLIRYLRDQNITFTRYRDAEEVDWETVPVWGKYTLKVEGLAEEKLLFTVYPDGSLALGDAEWGYLRAEAGSVDPQMLSDLLPDVDYSNKEDSDTFNLEAASSMRSRFWSLLKSPVKNAADSEDFSKEQVSAFLTYLAAQGVTFIRAEREGVAEKGRVMHLGEYYRLALCEDGSLLFWKEGNDLFFNYEIDAANLALRLSPDSVDRGVVDILLYSDYVRVYNENRLLKLGGLL